MVQRESNPGIWEVKSLAAKPESGKTQGMTFQGLCIERDWLGMKPAWKRAEPILMPPTDPWIQPYLQLARTSQELIIFHRLLMPVWAGFFSLATKVLTHLAAVRTKPWRAEALLLDSCVTKCPS